MDYSMNQVMEHSMNQVRNVTNLTTMPRLRDSCRRQKAFRAKDADTAAARNCDLYGHACMATNGPVRQCGSDTCRQNQQPHQGGPSDEQERARGGVAMSEEAGVSAGAREAYENAASLGCDVCGPQGWKSGPGLVDHRRPCSCCQAKLGGARLSWRAGHSQVGASDEQEQEQGVVGVDDMAMSEEAVAGEEAGPKTARTGGEGEAAAAESNQSVENVQGLEKCASNDSLSTADLEPRALVANNDSLSTADLEPRALVANNDSLSTADLEPRALVASNSSLSTANNELSRLGDSEGSIVSSPRSADALSMLAAAEQRLAEIEKGIGVVDVRRGEEQCSSLSQQIVSNQAEVKVANQENDFVKLAGISQALLRLQEQKSRAEARLKEAKASEGKEKDAKEKLESVVLHLKAGIEADSAQASFDLVTQRLASNKAEVEAANHRNDFVKLVRVSQQLVVLQEDKNRVEARLEACKKTAGTVTPFDDIASDPIWRTLDLPPIWTAVSGVPLDECRHPARCFIAQACLVYDT